MSKDDFLSRWSRRKQAVEQEKADAAVEEASETSSVDDPQLAMLEEGDANLIESEIDGEVEGENEGEETEPHPAEGIDIETLEYDSDFTVFMDKKVPETLRRMALRKLWRSNPILANIDGLNDYDEDFTDAATVFINSAGDVISGTRDQFWDDKQIAEGKDKIGKEEAEETPSEEAENDDTEAAEETEVAETEETEAAEAEETEIEDIEDADVEDIDDFDDLDFTTNDRFSQPEQSASSAEAVEEEKPPVKQTRLEDGKDRD